MIAGGSEREAGENVVRRWRRRHPVLRAVDGAYRGRQGLVGAKEDFNKGNADRINGLRGAMQGRAEIVAILVKAARNVTRKTRTGLRPVQRRQGGIGMRPDPERRRDAENPSAQARQTPRKREGPEASRGDRKGPRETPARRPRRSESSGGCEAPAVEQIRNPHRPGPGEEARLRQEAYDSEWAVNSKWQKDAGRPSLDDSEGPVERKTLRAWVAKYSPSEKRST